MPLEKFFSAIGKILQCHWKNSSVPLEEFSAIGRIHSTSKLEGGWKAGRAGPDTQKSNFFFDSQMIGGLFRAQSRVRLAPKTNFSGPAGPDKNDNFYHFFPDFFPDFFSIPGVPRCIFRNFFGGNKPKNGRPGSRQPAPGPAAGPVV